jgi:ribosomal protein L11 methylase PrmA
MVSLMKYIYCEIQTNNPSPMEEALDFDLISSVIIDGKKGFEIKNDNILDLAFSKWVIKVFAQSPEELPKAQENLEAVCQNLNIIISDIKVVEDNEDYVTKNQMADVLHIGSFIVYNDYEAYKKHIKSAEKKLTPIFVEHSTAFGTGKHETTLMCMEFIDQLVLSNYIPRDCLDLGTGSGILAIAVAKKFRNFGTKVLATDLDELALKKANELIEKNNVADYINPLLSLGFDNIQVGQKFSLILANVLLKPLVEMAKDFYNSLDNKGIIILSGILEEQAAFLLHYYQQIGFKAISQRNLNGWSALMLQKV